ncbi:MAG: hemerythrin family protein [Humidesulfovibrio sp.]|uniref:bacteriohemerythrin n=1 Tax=Humidesulfovibrio sp. TaxID=2910988 RepID=UPI0027F4C3BE|nr:hemerythrin family protein [Humidesulfovibrio sp.]MDQ7836516.1 hemerythrin family protein [Humidesulfovibrio sp.]
MSYLDWDDRMAIGHEVIDAQHRQLVTLINGIAEATARRGGRQEIGALIRAFSDYAQEHFSTEQDLMDSTDYPEYFLQLSSHEDCTTSALSFYRDYINGLDVSVEDFLSFVAGWFKGHTLGVDQTLRKYLKKKASPDPLLR